MQVITNFMEYIFCIYMCVLFVLMIIDFVTNYKYDLIDKIYEPVLIANLLLIILIVVKALNA